MAELRYACYRLAAILWIAFTLMGASTIATWSMLQISTPSDWRVGLGWTILLVILVFAPLSCAYAAKWFLSTFPADIDADDSLTEEVSNEHT